MPKTQEYGPLAHKHIIIYDGVCHLCNSAVNFIIRRDSNSKFCFVPMQSALAQELVGECLAENTDDETIILIKNDQFFVRSDAALEIAKNLDGFWRLLSIFRVVPISIRDWVYRLIARHRYRLFGRSDQCIAPSDAMKIRFLGFDQITVIDALDEPSCPDTSRPN